MHLRRLKLEKMEQLCDFQATASIKEAQNKTQNFRKITGDRPAKVLALGSELDHFWQENVVHWSRLHIDSGASLEVGRFFMSWSYIFTQTEEILRDLGDVFFFFLGGGVKTRVLVLKVGLLCSDVGIIVN